MCIHIYIHTDTTRIPIGSWFRNSCRACTINSITWMFRGLSKQLSNRGLQGSSMGFVKDTTWTYRSTEHRSRGPYSRPPKVPPLWVLWPLFGGT